MKSFPLIAGDSDNKLSVVGTFQMPALMLVCLIRMRKDSVKCTQAQHVLSAQPHDRPGRLFFNN